MRGNWKYRGFAMTLDMAVVVLCISILLLVVFLGFQSYIKTSKISQAKSDVAALSIAVSRYAYDMENAYPDNSPGECLPSNLTDLESKDETTGYGPWLTGNSIKKSGSNYVDPWNQNYVYSHGSGSDGRFVIYSTGPDKDGAVTLDGETSGTGIGASGGYQQ